MAKRVKMLIGKGNIERETEKAVLVWGNWWPKSQIVLRASDPEQPYGVWVFDAPYWLVRKNYTWDGIMALVRAGNTSIYEEA